ncbi:hypothetical protein DW979_12580 [Eubacterium sp. AM49-13BH]|jgi:DNA polymerase-3 subunit gamma/tau|nr:hypothetical protein DW979_12580 [Eubacterium sp. AM49-13BH]
MSGCKQYLTNEQGRRWMHLARGTLYNILRPQRFLEVIGQDNTVKSIQMALSKGVLEHALIFYGQTGGGKTTLARIVQLNL